MFIVEAVDDLGEFSEDELHWVAALVAIMDVMIISQTCDIAHREFTLVCPVFALSSIDNDDRAQATRSGRIYHRFYLPEIPRPGNPEEMARPESFAELSVICAVRQGLISTDRRIASLTHTGGELLAGRLSRFFSRPAQD